MATQKRTTSSNEPERVQKILAAAGLCSRREAEDWIRSERVEVNGKIVKIGESATRKDHITVNGVRVTFPKLTYLMLHKPKGYVTTMRDMYGKRTVLDLVHSDERIYPVGRLDKDTTGLLLFTNDGEFANRVMHPRYELEKVYVATLDKPFNPADTLKFESGIRFEEGIVRAKIKQRSMRRVEITLHQGYNHVVKRLCAAFGYKVIELERIRIGPLVMNIPIDAYRPLKQEEVDALLAAAQPKPRPSSRLPGELLRTRFGTPNSERATHFVPAHDRLSKPRGPPKAAANMWEELGPAKGLSIDNARDGARRQDEAPRPKRMPREIELRAPRAPFSREPGARRYGGKRDKIPVREPPRAFKGVASRGTPSRDDSSRRSASRGTDSRPSRGSTRDSSRVNKGGRDALRSGAASRNQEGARSAAPRRNNESRGRGAARSDAPARESRSARPSGKPTSRGKSPARGGSKTPRRS